ncbi:MAG: PilZ protein, partial [Acidobacteriota bacterium]|nr:PilZ protein [Acidobacteriota bacterium]
CAVLNISNKGILLETNMPVFWFPISENLQFELEIDGEWASINGTVKWVVSDTLHSRIGVFIRQAPEVYLAYLKKIYSS